MGGILSRFSSRKDEKPATDSRSAATIRKRWSWRSNKKPSDVGGTTVNRSSTMPTRTRLQPTEEIPEDRKHDDIFDSEHDEKNYSNSVVTSNQNDYASQHSSGQQEQHNVECANKPIVHEIPEKKDEKQPIQISSTNEPENKDNVTREISTEEAELLISHVLPNQENVGPNENITGSGTNGSLTHDNINFNHTEDLIVNKQQLEEKLDHSIHDSGLMMDQQEITKDQNGFFDSTQHHFEDKTDLLKEYIHSEITGEEIKLGQNPPVYLPSEEIEEFVHQNIRKHDSNQQLKVENDIIEQGGEENLNTESSNHNEVTQPVICFYRPNVVEYPPPEEIQLNDIDEQTYNQQTNIISNIQSSGIVGEKDSIYGQVVQNESLECSAELRAFHDLSNNEELPNSELIDKDNKVNFVETENTLDNVISEHVEQKNTFQETLEKELNESLMNAGETKILSADEPPINLNDKIHVEQTENISHPEYTEHDAPIDEKATLNELDKCSSQPGLTYDPVPSLSPITTEPINLDDDMHAEQTEKISHPENMESINLGDEIHVEQTENISHPKYTEHDAPIDEKATLNELDKCSSQLGLTYDPVPSLSPITTEPINLDDDMHAEQTEKISHPENLESINLNDEIHVEQTEKISHPENMESINLDDEIHVEQTENISHPKYTEHDAPIDEKATLNELDKCSSQPGLTYDPVPSLSPITTESNNLDDDMHAEQNQYTSPSESNVNNNIPVEKSIHTVLESPTEPVTEYNFSSNESHFTSELVLSEDNKEVTKDVDLEHSTEDLKTEDIHRKQINDTETLTTFEESVNNLHNTLNSTHIDDVIDQHQTLETLHDENHTDVQLNTDIMNVITSENLHTNLINANDEFEYEAQSLVQSVLNNAKEFVFNENNFENHQNSDTINTNLILTNNNSNNNDYLTNNNSYINEEDTIEGMKQNMTMKASMEFDHSDLSESNNQHLNNTNDLTIA
ncbi:unnamed protein product [Schistosoma rodhaini]|uniref:Spc7 domain-containing protein n=1 Tax=Schistosoma rodhaini TaxID=6188 RepID=A0AA85GFW1_9TREM|nr:unnamed protein product [Schistosoma rodhaini]